MAVTDCTLDQMELQWKTEAAATVVAASGGYPGDFETGRPIEGLGKAAEELGCAVFHAGTKRLGDRVVTDGGRVLSVTGLGSTLEEALIRAYTGLGHIHFDGMHYRRDIGARALSRIA